MIETVHGLPEPSQPAYSRSRASLEHVAGGLNSDGDGDVDGDVARPRPPPDKRRSAVSSIRASIFSRKSLDGSGGGEGKLHDPFRAWSLQREKKGSKKGKNNKVGIVKQQQQLSPPKPRRLSRSMIAATDRRSSVRRLSMRDNGGGGGCELDLAALEKVGRMMRDDADAKLIQTNKQRLRPPPVDLDSSANSGGGDGIVGRAGAGAGTAFARASWTSSGLDDSGADIRPALFYGAKTRRLSQESGVLPTPTSNGSRGSSSSVRPSRLSLSLPPVRGRQGGGDGRARRVVVAQP